VVGFNRLLLGFFIAAVLEVWERNMFLPPSLLDVELAEAVEGL
jgi:hypothetical protein